MSFLERQGPVPDAKPSRQTTLFPTRTGAAKPAWCRLSSSPTRKLAPRVSAEGIASPTAMHMELYGLIVQALGVMSGELNIQNLHIHTYLAGMRNDR